MKRKFTFLMAALALLALFILPITGWGQTRATVDDKLTADKFAATNTNYTDFSNVTFSSDAVYAGQSAKTLSGGIQLRSKNSNSGIITTSSGGTIHSVHVTVESGSNTLDVYGKNTAYTAASDLYSSSTQGTKIGSINATGEVNLGENADVYQYIGLRSNNGALYLTNITITWTTGSGSSVATPYFTPTAGTYTEAQSVTISCETTGSSIYYTTDGTTPTNESSQYTGAISVTETTTIKAIAYVGEEASSVASATYTIVTPYTTIPDIFAKAQEVGSTQTDIYVTFGNWTVVGKSYSNAYVTDGQYGLNIYGSGSGFAIGDKLSGTVACKVQLYTQGAELVNLTTATPGLTVTHDNVFNPYEISLANLTGHGIYFGSYVDLGNLTYSDSKFNDGNGNEIIPYNTFSITSYPTLTEGKTYRVKGVYIRYNSTTERIAPVYASDFTEYAGPSLAIDPTTANPFTYVLGAGPSAEQIFEVTGTNLTSTDIVATITSGADYFEITDDQTYSNTVTIASGDYISVRMKAGLALGSDYAGVLTLTNEGAASVTLPLSGSVTGATYSIVVTQPASGGTIEADKETAEAGTTVTLTATPAAAFNFGSWTVEDEDENPIEVTGNPGTFTMPAKDVLVSATFTAKPTYQITCVATPTEGGELISDIDEAYEGQTVTLSYSASTGYNLTSIVITKTEGGSATDITPVASGDDFTFEMPGYAVTATATFVSDTYNGSFVLFTGEMEEGDYILVYDNGAMNNTISSSRFGITTVEPSSDIIVNPSRDIVWHIAPSSGSSYEGYWTIKNEKQGKYVNAAASATTVSFVDSPNNNGQANWNITSDDDHKFSMRNKSNESQTSARYLGRNADYGFANYGSSYGVKLTLYKYTALTERTITFNGNGGTYNAATTYTQTVYDGVATNLMANQFEKSGVAFAGWNTEDDGTGTAYADGAEITVTSDITLYAQWSTAYTAMVDDEIVGGTVLINGEEVIEAAEGTEITLSYTAATGYKFTAWNVYKNGDATTTVTVTDNKFNMPAYNVIVSASFAAADVYTKVNLTDLTPADVFVIVGNNGSNYAMSNDNGTSSAPSAVAVNVVNNSITEPADNLLWNITITDEGYTFYPAGSATTWLYCTNTNNGVRVGTNANKVFTWDNAYLKNTGSSRYVGVYSSSDWRCYTDYNTDNIKNQTFSFYKLVSSDSYNKSITKYSDDRDNYYLIASPVASVTPTNENGFLTTEYDLYAFDESQGGAEWRNYEVNSFNLVSGKGYLYASSSNTELNFTGQPYNGNGLVELAYTEGKPFAGWNLIGNPFGTSAIVNKPYYKLAEGGSALNTEVYTESTPVSVMEGLFVQATEAGQYATFTKQSRGERSYAIAQANIMVSQNGSTIDNAIVRFDNGQTLGKFQLHENSTKVYFTEDHKDYAIIRSEARSEMPVNFKAAEDGTYTISVETENLDVNYLHLIDNKTGMDVDLLATPSYTFEGKRTDYASRFRLVFDANNGNNETSDEFAFMSDGNIIVNGTGTVQVIDMLGRQIFSHEVNSAFRIPNSEFTTGVYVLRLVNGNNVKTQKIVIK